MEIDNRGKEALSGVDVSRPFLAVAEMSFAGTIRPSLTLGWSFALKNLCPGLEAVGVFRPGMAASKSSPEEMGVNDSKLWAEKSFLTLMAVFSLLMRSFRFRRIRTMDSESSAPSSLFDFATRQSDSESEWPNPGLSIPIFFGYQTMSAGYQHFSV